jgi:primosomal protein N' (replication factor Y) (superfamily II helicase)
MTPPGLNQVADVLYELTDGGLAASVEQSLAPVAARLVSLLKKRGPLRGRQLDLALPRQDWRAAARPLHKSGILTSRSVLPPPGVQPKVVRTAGLACTPEEARAALPGLGKPGSAAFDRRKAALEFLIQEVGPVEVPWVYASSGSSLADLRFLANLGLILLGESQVWRDPLEKLEFTAVEAPPLTRGQQEVWEQIQTGLDTACRGMPVQPFLLHGVTGSGKTEIYLRAVEETLRQGKQAIILVPEISLTPQTVRRFAARFPGQVGLAHHQLSTGERYDTWRRARSGKLSVVVGPRSALFTPFPRLGLVVVDEFHDDSYYQSESPPHYHASQAAVWYARMAGAVCLLGSATPDVCTRAGADPSIRLSEAGPQFHYLSLPARILGHQQAVQAQATRLGIVSRYQAESGLAETIDLPPVQLVDMRQELKAGNTSIFSRRLVAALEEVLERKQQAILFLNRRGSATYVFCRDCGYSVKCPRCDIPLTSHGLESSQAPYLPSALPGVGQPGQVLVCHYCGYRRKPPPTCPECRSRRIRHFGAGTERVVDEVRALFPQIRTLRWDYETTRQKGAHELILSHFANHQADVLVGTQMIAKGLDLPLVTLVGVVLADVGLNLPDFRAAERTFQILTQVAGRAGRSLLGGEVILQTFQPDHYVLQAASRHDYPGFYQKELEYRRKLEYPPFGRLVRLEYRHPDPARAEKAAQDLAGTLRAWMVAEDRRATEMIGPAPCFFARTGGIYRWQIILRGPDPVSLLRNREIRDWSIEVDPVSLL